MLVTAKTIPKPLQLMCHAVLRRAVITFSSTRNLCKKERPAEAERPSYYQSSLFGRSAAILLDDIFLN